LEIVGFVLLLNASTFKYPVTIRIIFQVLVINSAASNTCHEIRSLPLHALLLNMRYSIVMAGPVLSTIIPQGGPRYSGHSWNHSLSLLRYYFRKLQLIGYIHDLQTVYNIIIMPCIVIKRERIQVAI
jgi:hypothetical protein